MVTKKNDIKTLLQPLDLKWKRKKMKSLKKEKEPPIKTSRLP